MGVGEPLRPREAGDRVGNHRPARHGGGGSTAVTGLARPVTSRANKTSEGSVNLAGIFQDLPPPRATRPRRGQGPRTRDHSSTDPAPAGGPISVNIDDGKSLACGTMVIFEKALHLKSEYWENPFKRKILGSSSSKGLCVCVCYHGAYKTRQRGRARLQIMRKMRTRT